MSKVITLKFTAVVLIEVADDHEFNGASDIVRLGWVDEGCDVLINSVVINKEEEI